MTSPLETFKGIFMVMTTRNLISLALMVHSTYLQMARMMKMMLWVMVRMDGSLSHLISLLVAEIFHRLSLSIPFHLIGMRVTTDSANNPLFGSSMITQIVMQVLH